LIGWVIGILFLRTIDWDKDGKSTISCKPIIVQVNPFNALSL
jgi:hypothetical protein